MRAFCPRCNEEVPMPTVVPFVHEGCSGSVLARLRKELDLDRARIADLETQLAQTRAEIAEMTAERDAALADVMEMRKFLWLSHGHTALYGDDGEMQCVACENAWDYKNGPVAGVIAAAERTHATAENDLRIDLAQARAEIAAVTAERDADDALIEAAQWERDRALEGEAQAISAHAETRARCVRLEESLRDLKSYLGAAGQDIDHVWLATRIIAALTPAPAKDALTTSPFPRSMLFECATCDRVDRVMQSTGTEGPLNWRAVPGSNGRLLCQPCADDPTAWPDDWSDAPTKEKP